MIDLVPVAVEDLNPLARVTLRMIGRRYGSVQVLGIAGRHYVPSGFSFLYLRLRCDCGREYVTAAHRVRQGTRGCTGCRDKRNAVKGRTTGSVQLPNGWTIAQVALAHGLDNGTVYRRWLRGWPVERLGEPLQKGGGGAGFGKSHDLEERRGLVFGRGHGQAKPKGAP